MSGIIDPWMSAYSPLVVLVDNKDGDFFCVLTIQNWMTSQKWTLICYFASVIWLIHCSELSGFLLYTWRLVCSKSGSIKKKTEFLTLNGLFQFTVFPLALWSSAICCIFKRWMDLVLWVITWRLFSYTWMTWLYLTVYLRNTAWRKILKEFLIQNNWCVNGMVAKLKESGNITGKVVRCLLEYNLKIRFILGITIWYHW